MKKCLNLTLAVLSLFIFPTSALANTDGVSLKYHEQSRHSDKPEHRRHKTDHKAVEQRIAKRRLAQNYNDYLRHNYNLRRHYKRDRHWVKNNLDTVRFISRRDFYKQYYGHGNGHFYDRHRNHYDRHHRRNSLHLGDRHHSHSSDYLDWFAVMYLLNEISDGRYSEHDHRRRGI
ncbi:hypothetical protein N2382_08860 [SAR92 clade bacterium H921]|nr:hypothetical protein [SAR92 clade bacterium H921]